MLRKLDKHRLEGCPGDGEVLDGGAVFQRTNDVEQVAQATDGCDWHRLLHLEERFVDLSS